MAAGSAGGAPFTAAESLSVAAGPVNEFFRTHLRRTTRCAAPSTMPPGCGIDVLSTDAENNFSVRSTLSALTRGNTPTFRSQRLEILSEDADRLSACSCALSIYRYESGGFRPPRSAPRFAVFAHRCRHHPGWPFRQVQDDLADASFWLHWPGNRQLSSFTWPCNWLLDLLRF